MATMAENIGSEHMGKIAGLSSALTAAGTTAGPVIAGLLFELGGYWCAWAGAAGFLFVDIIMRLIMTEKPVKSQRVVGEQEEEPFLVDDDDDAPATNGEQPNRPSSLEVRGWHFYACLFREMRFSAGIFCNYVFALLIGCFESTLAVHVRTVFGWRALHVGLLLALIQAPGMLLAAPVGWMKDKVGSRTPTMVGFFSLVPFIILLGVPGDSRFQWDERVSEKSLYVVCMALIGCLMCLLNGVGSMEATGK